MPDDPSDNSIFMAATEPSPPRPTTTTAISGVGPLQGFRLKSRECNAELAAGACTSRPSRPRAFFTSVTPLRFVCEPVVLEAVLPRFVRRERRQSERQGLV